MLVINRRDNIRPSIALDALDASIEGGALAVVGSGEGELKELLLPPPLLTSIEGAGDGRMLMPRKGEGADVRVGSCVGPALGL
jgi:hypothetical protein